MTQDIYISKWLEKNYKVVYDQLSRGCKLNCVSKE